MIKKLQRRYILISMGSLTLVMLLLVGSINLLFLYQMNRKINSALSILTANKGQFPLSYKIKPSSAFKFDFEINEETRYEIRYFVVEVNNDGSIRDTDTSHIAAISSEDASVYAKNAIKSKITRGYKSNYKYAVEDRSYGHIVVFMDCRTELENATIFLLISCTMGLITLLLVFILVSTFSKKAINPMIESMEKQKQFITDAGHEIKTPLAIISANADVLELINGKNEWITSIRNQTIRLNKLVKNLLMLSKMDEDSIKLIFTDINLSNLVMDTATSFKPIAEAANKSFEIDVKKDIMLNADESSITQLISTLIDNALKYSNEGGVIKISLVPIKKGCKFEITNTSDYIDTNNLNRLFDRFYRADSSRSRDTGGYGIGLSIAKSIVEAHHGKITAKSTDGKSIKFTVIL